MESYPTEILPNIAYKQEMNVDFLLRKYPNLLVARLVEGSEEDYLFITEHGEKIMNTKVFKNNMANLSLNLAGGLFITDRHSHLRFLPNTKKGSSAWDGTIIKPELYSNKECYNICSKCFGLCFYVRDIHERTFPFYKHFESKEERDIYKSNVDKAKSEVEKNYEANFVAAFENKKKTVEVRPIIRVHHSPTMLNYWHMTLDTYRPTDIDYVRPDEKLNSSDKNMFRELKQDLVQFCMIDRQPDYQIDTCCYMK